MRESLAILFIVSIFGLYGCDQCSPCLAKGENFDLPYISGQIVTFINDSLNQESYIVSTRSPILPPKQYCGSVGSSSYGTCDGFCEAKLKNVNDSNESMTIHRIVNADDAVENNVRTDIFVLNGNISISNSSLPKDLYNVGQKVAKLMVNGVNYENVYIYQNDTAKINECTYFAFCISFGVIRFSIQHQNYIENWNLQKSK